VDEAVVELREAVRLQNDFPDANLYLNHAERLVKLKPRLPALLKGETQPADVDERLELAWDCSGRRMFAAAAHWYDEALAAWPGLAEEGDRYFAASVAALAGCGQGEDAGSLGDTERARLRRQTLDWLRADLEASRSLMESEPGKSFSVAQKMICWLSDSDFAGVRDSRCLSQLPEAEGREWQSLWKEVEELRRRAANPPEAASPGRR
jgi:hypothetical protein